MSILEILATILCSVLASSGLWAIIQKKMDKNDNRTKLIVGLAHDRIITCAMIYLDRGYITQDEYENLHDYLFVPYKALGGNGSAERVMKEIEKLPIKSV